MVIPYRDSRVITAGLILFFVIALGYAYYEARGLLNGPSIDINPRVLEATTSFIRVSGTADRISSLTMNGKPITVTENGSFEEPYVLAPGYNRITLEAKDKYGKSATRDIEIMYQPEAPAASGGNATGAEASSTMSTSTTSIK